VEPLQRNQMLIFCAGMERAAAIQVPFRRDCSARQDGGSGGAYDVKADLFKIFNCRGDVAAAL
jgi:hypothetical protein